MNGQAHAPASAPPASAPPASAPPASAPPGRVPARVVQGQRVALVDLLDRVLAGGVVITGDITLCIAGVDLVTVSLRALVASVSALAGEDHPLLTEGRR